MTFARPSILWRSLHPSFVLFLCRSMAWSGYTPRPWQLIRCKMPEQPCSSEASTLRQVLWTGMRLHTKDYGNLSFEIGLCWKCRYLALCDALAIQLRWPDSERARCV